MLVGTRKWWYIEGMEPIETFYTIEELDRPAFFPAVLLWPPTPRDRECFFKIRWTDRGKGVMGGNSLRRLHLPLQVGRDAYKRQTLHARGTH